MENNYTIVKLVSSGVTQRSKWDRKSGKKLVKKVYVSRQVYLDAMGKKREKTKEFLRKKEADDHAWEQKRAFERSGGREIEAAKMSFNDLADHYEKHYAKPAEYAGDQKISGLRSLEPVLGYLRTLRKFFGKSEVKRITYSMIREYRDTRLKTPVVITKKIRVPLTRDERVKLKTRRHYREEKTETRRPRKIASVNRELTTLRHMFGIAEMEGWIPKNPFRGGPGLIQVSAEEMRQRILSKEEEERVLAICDTEERRHLRSIIICLLDTGMRFNELRTLTWAGVDLSKGLINIKAFNTKTAKPKTVAMSKRLRNEFEYLLDQRELRLHLNDPNLDLVFGVKSNVKNCWTTVRRLAGIEDVRLHDLRHTFGTRLNQAGLSQASIARSLGHQQISTTYRYINAEETLLDSVRSALDKFNSSAEQ